MHKTSASRTVAAKDGRCAYKRSALTDAWEWGVKKDVSEGNVRYENRLIWVLMVFK